MGSLEDISIGLEGALLLILGLLAIARTRKGVVATLGLLWCSLALFDFSLLGFPEWTTWREFGSYFIFITAMAYHCLFQRPKPQNRQRVSLGSQE
jgi:hypothetical protein